MARGLSKGPYFMNKGGKFQRNCGAASVGIDHYKIIWFLSTELIN